MKIIKQNEAAHVSKPEGTEVWYYLRDEYELHLNEQIAGSTQTWHHHETISETVLILEGELTAEWVEDGKAQKMIVKKGDFIETEKSSHTFTNHTSTTTKFIVLKQVLSGQNKREIMKNDKVIDKETTEAKPKFEDSSLRSE